MKNILILFSILLFGGLILNANAQSANHVVINEVDTNPPGDDSKSISEWVELYNPTNSKIDISGWKIASTSGMKKTLSIPTGTFIESGKFLTFTFDSLWFTDNNEVVELKDKNGVSIDTTPLISDLKSDFTSWQRIYDGYDSDSVSDWKFVTSTAGSTNGKLTAVKETDALSITVSSAKSSYLFGETAIIQGKVSKQVFVEKPYFHSDEIIVKISGPSYDKTISLYPDLNLNYKTSFSLQQVLGINKGTYSVLVSYGGATSQTSFSVGDKLVVETIPEESTLSITTNKSQYFPGDTLSLTGITSKVIPFEGLKFTIKDPNGNIISTGSLYPTNGKFSTNIFLSTVNPIYGKYSVTAEYFDKGAISFFDLVKDIKEEKAISLWTDKDAYNLGETVTVTGRLNQLWIAFVDLGITQTKNISSTNTGGIIAPLKISDTLKISGDGSFTYSFKIPDNSNGLGDYTITVSKDIGTASKVIRAVTNSTGYVASTAPLSVSTDKAIYDLGDNMIIEGFIANPVTSSTLQNLPVKISVYHEDGSPLEIIGQKPATKTRMDNGIIVAYEFTAIPESSGRFTVQTKITPNAFAEGSYKIKAEYKGLVKSTLIGVVDPLKSNSGAVLSLNKQVYGLGEPVLLSGLVPTFGGSSVQISLTTPDGSVVNSGVTINNQRFSWSWTTPITEKPLAIKQDDRSVTKTNYGIYKIHVTTASANKDIFFKVSSNPESDSLSLSPIIVSTEKSLYKAGEKLKVVGNIIAKEQLSQGLIPQRVTIQVLDGEFPYKQIFESTVYPESGGTFQSLFELPVSVFTEGEYKIKAMYSGKKAEATFSVANDFAIGSDAKLSLLLATDKSEYYPGDTVNISGKPNKLIYIEKFDVSVIQKVDGSVTCGTFFCGKHLGPVTSIRPSSSGSFSHQFQIPNTQSSLGSYEITVDAGFATKSLMFNVVEKPIVVETKQSASILIEKVNRILDSQIRVLTSEKTDDDNVILPRVFSGSLITAKTDQSTVNLRVTSESGVCVIGPDETCLVKDSTRKPGQIYEVVSVDGVNLKIRYSGPDVYLEKFDILPESPDGFLPNAKWTVDIIKEEQASRFYYRINYSVLG
ncbi:hypothetical protein Nlim_0176 [Candidatus Nitrosarchaeum limnium SFB1]|jgi:hypothetical protein|uniref:LTD domain-containing protein n=1 Tax=Candidatus Nitrosarchaeum limnium SFB1 TaxID=886738 RepID=F3KI82_9ARCH|nr:hypothetical protein Nlim_0176 [Candidatus Nitrosarchaeum limnium SFB1]